MWGGGGKADISPLCEARVGAAAVKSTLGCFMKCSLMFYVFMAGGGAFSACYCEGGRAARSLPDPKRTENL